MKERGVAAWDQAKKEIPVKWYEHEIAYRVAFIVVGMGLAASEAIYVGVPLHHLVGGLVYVLSAIADDRSTLKTLRA